MIKNLLNSSTLVNFFHITCVLHPEEVKMNDEMSLVIGAAVHVMEKTVHGLKVTVLDKKMSRSEPTTTLPLGMLGIRMEFDWEYVGKKNVFIGYEMCEDMLTPIGELVAEEIVYKLFFDELQKIKGKLNL